MERAFVFANVVAGSEIEVLKELRNIPDVKEAYFVYGVYDIVVIVETDSMARLREISAQIRSLSNIRSTSTTVAMQG
jgi:DNA-binding Lrp family transcriptional regulator